MKVWIDQRWGYYYHKNGCSLMLPEEFHKYHFTEIDLEEAVRKSYRPCPLCMKERNGNQ